MAKHLHANNDDFARCYYDDPTTIHLVISDPIDYFGQVHKAFTVPRATHNGPGRHRFDDMATENSPAAVYMITEEKYQDDPRFIGKFECPRRWHDGAAVEFEYL